MREESKICQNCKSQFAIEPEDFKFYEKIQVPPPTWCPECRLQRRYAWRNERVLYRRNCDMCAKSTVSIYSPNKPFTVYCPPCWWSDKWDSLSYGQTFDFSKPFFEQFQNLQLKVPRIALLVKNSVSSEYTHHSSNNKNCYLSFSIFDSENVLYSTNVYNVARDCCDCYHITKNNELLYECIDCERCYQCQYGILLRDSTSCFYCYDCRGCSNCFLSWNLRNKQYYILNEPYTKEMYIKKIEQFRLDSFFQRKKLYANYLKLIQEKALHRFAVIEKSNDTSGNMILRSKNAHYAFDTNDAEDSKYVIVSVGIKDCMDSYHFGFKTELVYESHALTYSYHLLFTHLSYENSYLQYCDSCHNSENLFGSVGVKHGNYCILNKPYRESEYKALKEKIVMHMRKTGEYGEFFPPSISPFGYNETQGQVYMPLTREEVEKRGWKWEDKVPGTFGKETLKSKAIPDSIHDISDGIVNEVLACTRCKRNYNIIKPELNFYRKENIPLPRECPDCRYRRKIALRPPRKPWHRACQCAGKTSEKEVYKNTIEHFHKANHCPNEFETSYSPDREEIVYCEKCYLAEVV
ncbi:MAG: hypothetical protein HY001_02175 [Candidatus Portnoybacteria bacterium]|nr:hypothetical protein [Candidatus Portnoybacteria bacterium]